MPSAFDSVMEFKRPDLAIDPSPSQKKEVFSGIPSYNKSTMLDYAVEEGDQGERILSFLIGDSVVNFKLNQPKEKGDPITAMRLADVEKGDFGARGNSVRGKLQIHKSSPNSIYGTIHGGDRTMTFSLDNPSTETNEWTLSPKKHPISDVADFVKSVDIQQKKAFKLPTMDQITAPLTADYPTAMALSALIGSGVMGARNLGLKAWAKLTGEEDPTNPLWQDLALGAGGGALASGAFKAIGEADKHLGTHAPRFNHHLPKFMERRYDFNTPSYLKTASDMEKKANTVEISRIQNLLSYDVSLTPADRRILLSQLQDATRLAQNGQIDINRLRNSGMGMLFGYLTAKFLGFGVGGQIASTALGGFVGSNSTPKGGKQWDTRGFYHY
jgi:hypothetical protein